MSCETGSIRANISANGQFVLLPVGGYGSLGIDVRGTFVGTLTFQASINGEDWLSLPALPIGTTTNAAVVTTTTTVGAWLATVAGISQVRVIFTAYTSGSAIVTIRAEDDPSMVYNLSNGAAAGQTVTGTVTANEGTPQTGTAYSLVTAATTNGANIKATAGNLFEIAVSNVTAATIFVKFYNKATAPTVGTDVPIITIPVTAGQTIALEFGRLGKRFALGIGIAVTAAAAATDTTVVTAGAQISGTYI